MRAFTQFIQHLYGANKSQYPDGGQAAIREMRENALALFLKKELPDLAPKPQKPAPKIPIHPFRDAALLQNGAITCD